MRWCTERFDLRSRVPTRYRKPDLLASIAIGITTCEPLAVSILYGTYYT